MKKLIIFGNGKIAEAVYNSMLEDDDFKYVDLLFSETMNRDYELEKIISKRVKNWDTSRIAMTDLVILKMALAEMMT